MATDASAALHPGRRADHGSSKEAGKRLDIISGARKVFFEKGFDRASMDEIARVSGVSKATIYVYFTNKEELFQALVETERQASAERLFEYDPDAADIESLLQHIGMTFMTMMVRPDHIRLIRMVIAVAETFPAIGRTFFETGPSQGGQRLAMLLKRQTELGHLHVEDAQQAAFQFFNLCQGDLVKSLLFGGGKGPSHAEIEAVVRSGVQVFLAAYGRRPAPGTRG
ncbi:MAG: TetR/AcrR family transcriptional regulator [Xanthobacter sp.]